ncbi:zinc-ribbon domain-containing protein [Pseudomonas aeruginosa]|uniref:zinc-ribbon domain-containing protein n=1 Tax=Pseudomonas aeruginosa TaxID=287 RepID=UPI00071BBFC0|nr:zinc-ribbon domain-containing protein [Pseudomonas aeruginosa]
MGFFERLLMGGRHHGQGGGHHGGGHHRGQGGYPPAPVLRCIACNADLAAGAKFCGACGAPQQ